MPRRKKKTKITLIELMVLIAIVSILLSIVVPAAKRSAREKLAEQAPIVAVTPEGDYEQGGGGSLGGISALFAGFWLGVAVTLIYQRIRKIAEKSKKTTTKQEEEEVPSSFTVH